MTHVLAAHSRGNNLHERRYAIHPLTRTFLHQQVAKS